MQLVLYIHGKGGSASEAEHYRPLFPACEVRGLDYRAETPAQAGKEIADAVRAFKKTYDSVILIANSIGAYYAMYAGVDALIERAYFISPVVDLAQLICEMMQKAGVTRQQLAESGTVATDFGETLSWEIFCDVKAHPVVWNAPTKILYGADDELIAYAAVCDFAKRHGAHVTVMEHGQHWFHTESQMAFLDAWLQKCEREAAQNA